MTQGNDPQLTAYSGMLHHIADQIEKVKPLPQPVCKHDAVEHVGSHALWCRTCGSLCLNIGECEWTIPSNQGGEEHNEVSP